MFRALQQALGGDDLMCLEEAQVGAAPLSSVSIHPLTVRDMLLHPDIGELLEIQQTLACHCVDILDEGGILVYATCSLLKAESEDQVSKLVSNGLVDTLPIKESEVPGFEDSIDSNGWLRVIPGTLDGALSSTDGFFVARLIIK